PERSQTESRGLADAKTCSHGFRGSRWACRFHRQGGKRRKSDDPYCTSHRMDFIAQTRTAASCKKQSQDHARQRRDNNGRVECQSQGEERQGAKVAVLPCFRRQV